MEKFNSLTQNQHTINNKVLCRNIGIWPANIISEMLSLSAAHDGDWFPMEWQYLRDEFGVKGRSKIETAIKQILELGLFDTQLRYIGNAPKRCYKLIVNFDDWFYSRFGDQLWPRTSNLVVTHSVTREIQQNVPEAEILPIPEIHQNLEPVQLTDNEEFEENDLEKFIAPSNSIIVSSNSNKKCPKVQRKNQQPDGIKFYDFYRDNKPEVNAMLSGLGVPIKTCYEKIDEYYSRMTCKSKLRTKADWLTRLSRYITMYTEPDKLDHKGTEVKSEKGSSAYWNWVYSSLEGKRKAL